MQPREFKSPTPRATFCTLSVDKDEWGCKLRKVLSCVKYRFRAAHLSRPFVFLAPSYPFRRCFNSQATPSLSTQSSRARLESGATSVCASAAGLAVSAVRENLQADIPPCPAANLSKRDSQRADEPRPLRVGPHISFEALCGANPAWSTCGAGFILCSRPSSIFRRAWTKISATNGGGKTSSGEIVFALRLRGAGSESPATWDPWRSLAARSVRRAACRL